MAGEATTTAARSIGARLRQRRLELGLSQRQLAAPGISYAYISRIESGARNPSVKALRQLAPRLRTTVTWLETGEEGAAERLAALVLENRNRPLPRSALVLARQILGESA